MCIRLNAQSSEVHFTVSESSKNLKPKNLDIYLLIGQSNMAGRATIESQDRDTLNGVFLYKGIKGDVWEKAANSLNKYSSIRKNLSMKKLNAGYTFAREMAQSSEKRIGLIVNARGGTSIDLWVPGSEFYNEAIATELYDHTRQHSEMDNLAGNSDYEELLGTLS